MEGIYNNTSPYYIRFAIFNFHFYNTLMHHDKKTDDAFIARFMECYTNIWDQELSWFSSINEYTYLYNRKKFLPYFDKENSRHLHFCLFVDFDKGLKINKKLKKLLYSAYNLRWGYSIIEKKNNKYTLIKIMNSLKNNKKFINLIFKEVKTFRKKNYLSTTIHQDVILKKYMKEIGYLGGPDYLKKNKRKKNEKIYTRNVIKKSMLMWKKNSSKIT